MCGCVWITTGCVCVSADGWLGGWMSLWRDPIDSHKSHILCVYYLIPVPIGIFVVAFGFFWLPKTNKMNLTLASTQIYEHILWMYDPVLFKRHERKWKRVLFASFDMNEFLEPNQHCFMMEICVLPSFYVMFYWHIQTLIIYFFFEDFWILNQCRIPSLHLLTLHKNEFQPTALCCLGIFSFSHYKNKCLFFCWS